MNSLQATRELLAAQIATTGVPVFDHVPERITPPVAVIEPGAPYVEGGETFCDWRINLNVLVLAAAAANEVATDALDQSLAEIVDAVDTFDLVSIDTPTAFEVSTATYYGTRISFTTTTTIHS